MKFVPRIAAIAIAALSAAPATAVQQIPAAPSAPASMSCDAIAAELIALTGGVADNAARTQELAKVNAPASSVGGALVNQGVAALVNVLPGGAASAVATGVGIAQGAADKVRQKKVDQAIAETDKLEEAQLGNLDRLLALHELHQAKCEG